MYMNTRMICFAIPGFPGIRFALGLIFITNCKKAGLPGNSGKKYIYNPTHQFLQLIDW